MAPRWEKALHKTLVADQDYAGLRAVGEAHAEARRHAATFEALGHSVPQKDYARARELLTWVVHQEFDPATDPFIGKYMPGVALEISVADGVTAEMPLDRSLIGLSLGELHQQAGDLAGAIDIVERLEPTTITAVSLAELYAEQRRWQDVIELTDGVRNDDEASAFLLTQRGIAFRETGSHTAAREALKEALRVRSRPADLRHRALVERAATFIAERKFGMARNDLEKILAENSQYPGLDQALADLPETKRIPRTSRKATPDE